MTAPDPARLHQSSRQLEGDGGRVDVEQLQRAQASGYSCCACCPDDPGFHEDGKQDHHDIPCDTCVLDARDEARKAELTALRDLIRRQDAALTAKQAVIDAVTELHKPVAPVWAEYAAGRLGWGTYQTCSACFNDEDSEAENAWPCPTAAALASPDTTQDGGA